MAILQKQRARNPAAGYPADSFRISATCCRRAPSAASKSSPTPAASTRSVPGRGRSAREGPERRRRVRVAIVRGRRSVRRASMSCSRRVSRFINMDTGQAAVGRPRARAVGERVPRCRWHRQGARTGANVVITGRVADAAVTLAPMMFEFGWSATTGIACGRNRRGAHHRVRRAVHRRELHRLAAREELRRMGFPIVEAEEDGSFVVTKHPNTGGLVSVHTVTEQILYEIGPPAT